MCASIAVLARLISIMARSTQVFEAESYSGGFQNTDLQSSSHIYGLTSTLHISLQHTCHRWSLD